MTSYDLIWLLIEKILHNNESSNINNTNTDEK